MQDDEIAFSRILGLEKGLRDPNFLSVMQTIAEYSDLLLQSIQFPMAVTSGILKLSQVFRDSPQENIRYQVYCTLEKAKSCFQIFFGFDELCSRIFHVLTSSDPVARTLALKIFALFPAKLSSKPHIFHQIISNSLDSSWKEEQEIAIELAIQFAKLHESFGPFLMNYLNRNDSQIGLKHARLLLEVKPNGIFSCISLRTMCKSQFLCAGADFPKLSLLLRGLAKFSAPLSDYRKEFFQICLHELSKNQLFSQLLRQKQDQEQEEGEYFDALTDGFVLEYAKTIIDCLGCVREHFDVQQIEPLLIPFAESSIFLPSLIRLSGKFGGFFHEKLEKVAMKPEFATSFESILCFLKTFSFIRSKESFQMKLLGYLQCHSKELTFENCCQIAFEVSKLHFQDASFSLYVYLACFGNWPLYRFPIKLFNSLSLDEQSFLIQRMEEKTPPPQDLCYFFDLCIWNLKIANFNAAIDLMRTQLIPLLAECYLVHFFRFLHECVSAVDNQNLNMLFDCCIHLDKFSLGNKGKFNAIGNQIKEEIFKFALKSTHDWHSLCRCLIKYF